MSKIAETTISVEKELVNATLSFIAAIYSPTNTVLALNSCDIHFAELNVKDFICHSFDDDDSCFS